MTSLLHPWERSHGRTSVCFRYVTRRRPSRAYEVRILLKDDPRHGEIDIRHACRTPDDLPSFTSGFLSVARLRTIASLAGLIEHVTARDHSRIQPGALVFGGHLSFPFERRGDGAARAPRTASVQRKTYPATHDAAHERAVHRDALRASGSLVRHAPPRSERYRRHA